MELKFFAILEHFYIYRNIIAFWYLLKNSNWVYIIFPCIWSRDILFGSLPNLGVANYQLNHASTLILNKKTE